MLLHRFRLPGQTSSAPTAAVAIRHAVLILVALAATACSYPDDAYSTADFIGTFHLTASHTPVPVDFDLDGDSSHNFLNESECYHGSTLTVREDGTYTMRTRGIHLAGDTWTCVDEMLTTGTWTETETGIVTTQNSPGAGQGTTMHWTWSASGKTLTHVHEEGDYPFYDADAGAYLWRTGTVATIYTLSN